MGVHCALGHGAACALVNGARPSQEEYCEDFADCSWSLVCPFGWDGGVDCETQQLILILTISVFICCLCSCFAWKLHRKCKPPKSGTALLESNKVHSHFVVQDAKLTERGGAEHSDKQHIVWHTDTTVLEKLGVSIIEGRQDEMSVPPDEDDAAWTGVGANRATGGIQKCFPWNYSVFYSGDLVEYYSSRNERWLISSIESLGATVPFLGLADSGDALAIGNSPLGELDHSYNIRVGVEKQLRPFVALPLLRLPFCAGDAVEVYQRTGDQEGLWYAAEVCGKQSMSATSLGYKVKLIHCRPHVLRGTPHIPNLTSNPLVEDCPADTPFKHLDGEIRSNQIAAITRLVSSVWLRPRFPPGVDVDVYRGTQHGWRPAVTLASDCDADGCGREPVPVMHKAPVPSSPRAVPTSPTDIPDMARAFDADPNGPPVETLHMHYWTWVQVRSSTSLCAGAADTVVSETVPSFIVRTRSQRTHAPRSAQSFSLRTSAAARDEPAVQETGSRFLLSI